MSESKDTQEREATLEELVLQLGQTTFNIAKLEAEKNRLLKLQIELLKSIEKKESKEEK